MDSVLSLAKVPSVTLLFGVDHVHIITLFQPTPRPVRVGCIIKGIQSSVIHGILNNGVR